MEDPGYEHGAVSDGETTQGSMNLTSMDGSKLQSSTFPQDGQFEANTMSKREYYTLRDKNINPNQPIVPAQSPALIPPVPETPPGSKMKQCEVVMLDGSVQSFNVDMNSKASELFEATCTFLNLHEKEYFGLCIRDTSHMFFWLNPEKKLAKQIGKSEWKLELMVKFYPPDPENLRENLTRYYMALQIRQNLMAASLPCSFITYIVLGSYVVQSEVGDFDPTEERMNNLSYLQDCPFCPEEFRQPELLERLSDLHKCHTGMTPEEADLHFLNNAKKLALYGVDLHSAKDHSGEEVSVGVYHGGVIVYRNSLRINRLSWPKIIKVSYKRSTLKITIRHGDDKDRNRPEPASAKPDTVIEFKCMSPKLAKRLWLAVVEHHGFFRLKSPEKPAKPLIPGTFKRSCNYTGPTRGQLSDQPYATLPETQVTSDMRKSFRKKDDAFNRDYRTQQFPSEFPTYANETFATADRDRLRQTPREQFDRRPELPSERPARWYMCPSDADPLLSASLQCNPNVGCCPADSHEWQGVRADRGVCNGGQWYYEVTVDNANVAAPVDARVGWCTNSASLNVGQDAHGFAFGTEPAGQHGQKCHRGQPEPYGGPFSSGDVVGAFIDLDSGSVLYSLNGNQLGAAYQLSHELRHESFYPASCARNGARLSWNFGDDPANPLKFQPGGPWRACGLAPANQQAENPRNWRLNQHDTSGPGLTLGPNQCSAQSQLGFGWQGVRCNKGLRGKSGGKFYYEVEPLELRGLGRVGWTTEDGALDIGRDANGWGYGADHDGFGLAGNQSKKLHADEIDNYGEPFSKGDVVGCFFDLDHGQMQFCKNGSLFGPAYSLPITRLNQEAYFPTVCMRDQTMDVNLGQRPFKYPPGDEWTPVCMANEDSVRRSARTGVMDRKSKGFTYVDPRMLQESLSKRSSQLPSVDQKYDLIRESKSQIHSQQKPNGAQQLHEPDYSDDHLAKKMVIPTQAMGEGCEHGEYQAHHHHVIGDPTEKTFVTHSEEIGEPEEEIVTYTDEHGNKITKKVVRRKQVRKVITNKVVETIGAHGPPCFDAHEGASTEHLERTINGKPEVRTETRTTRRNIVISGEGDEDDMLNDIIYQQTGFSKEDKVLDENVNDFSMSTIDNRRNRANESDI